MKETKKVKDGGAEKDLLPYREQGMAGRLTYSFGQPVTCLRLPLVIMARRISEAGIVSDSSLRLP